jgi:hypothetical protein
MVIFQSYAIVIVCLFDGLYRHFEQYFNYIMATPEDPKKKPQTCHKSLTNFIT